VGWLDAYLDRASKHSRESGVDSIGHGGWEVCVLGAAENVNRPGF
jgi:hypothetical protein